MSKPNGNGAPGAEPDNVVMLRPGRGGTRKRTVRPAHPVEIARSALFAAAEVESDEHWRDLCERFARALPPRGTRA